jgi:hypothetical protein
MNHVQIANKSELSPIMIKMMTKLYTRPVLSMHVTQGKSPSLRLMTSRFSWAYQQG